MAASKETITTKVLVQPEWDKRAVKKMETDFGKVRKRLSSMKTDWAGVSKNSASAVKEIAAISKAAAAMSANLSDATKKSVKQMAELAKQLQEAKRRAEELKRKASEAGSAGEKETAAAGAAEAEKEMLGLGRQLREMQKTERRHLQEIKDTIKARKLERDQLKKTAASFSGKDLQREVGGSIRQAFLGMKGSGLSGLKSAGGAAYRAVKGGAQYSKAMSAKASLGEASQLSAGLSKLVPVLGGLAVGFSAFVGFIVKASSAITDMNKTLIESVGTANDFTTKTGAYTEAIDDLRKASKDATGRMLNMGATVEGTSKIINSYMREASGSIVKTRDAMRGLGKGDAAKGVEALARNAIAYGKALGMEANDVAAMMGKMENEIGLGAQQTQSLMGDIVKAAATANMPVSKFMDIFRNTIPSLELYTNRMEELTGVIKMLSKNMSAADVKKFMDAFSKGFKGMSFEERVQHTLVAGVPKTNKLLQKGFEERAENISRALGPDLQESFMAAFKKGDKQGMNKILAVAKSRGVQGATIGEAQKLMGAEADRRKGGALGTASAVKGASIRENMKIMEAELETFGHKAGTRISGMMEHVAERRGFGSDQVEAYNQYVSSMDEFVTSLQTYGTTVSKSMDAALKKLLASRLGKAEDQITPEDMAKASRNEIEQAAELSNKSEKVQQTAMDIAREQTDATLSLSDKVSNVIAYLLEQIYEKADGLLKVVNRILSSILDWISGDSEKAKGKAAIEKYNIHGYGKAEQNVFSGYKGALKAGVEEGKSGMQLAGSAGGFYKSQFEKMTDDQKKSFKDSFKANIEKTLSGRGMHSAQKANLMKGVDDALAKGNFGKALESVVAYSGKNSTDALLEFGQNVLPKAITDADKKDAESPTRRPGTEAVEVHKFQKDKEVADEISDTVSDLHEINKDGVRSNEKVADAVAKGSTTPATAAQPVPGTPEHATKTSTTQGMKQADAAHRDSVAQEKSNAKDIQKSTDDVYDGVHDVAGILKKGLRFEPSFLNGPYAKTLRDSTLDSFRDALIEYAVIQAKSDTAPGFKRFLADYSQEFTNMGSGAAMGLLTDVGKGQADPNAVLKQFQEGKERLEGSMQVGGPVPDTGMYRLHRGEYVVPAMAPDSGGGAGGATVNAVVNINGSQLTPKQLEHAVYGAMDKLARRP